MENAGVSRSRTTISDSGVYLLSRRCREHRWERMYPKPRCEVNEREGERWRDATMRHVYVLWWTLCKSRRIERHPEASPTGNVKLARGEAMTWFTIYYVWATSKYGALAPLPKSARHDRRDVAIPHGNKKNGSKSCKNENTRVPRGKQSARREREREGVWQTRRAANTREIRLANSGTTAKSREAKFPAAMVE